MACKGKGGKKGGRKGKGKWGGKKSKWKEILDLGWNMLGMLLWIEIRQPITQTLAVIITYIDPIE